MTDFHAAGGCLCGAVRFEASARPMRASYCHCTLCRRHTGAPVMLGVVFARADVAVTGASRSYASSASGRRHFCATCGASLFFTFEDVPERLEIMAGAFDDPSFIAPIFHLHTAERIACFDVVDDLPRFAHGHTG